VVLVAALKIVNALSKELNVVINAAVIQTSVVIDK
jgi:hypothetical protein